MNLNNQLLRLPIIKANVNSYAIEDAVVNFKILVYKDNFPIKKLKKTYAEFLELDQILDTKYAALIRQGVFFKGEFPVKDEYNFNQIQSIE